MPLRDAFADTVVLALWLLFYKDIIRVLILGSILAKGFGRRFKMMSFLGGASCRGRGGGPYDVVCPS